MAPHPTALRRSRSLLVALLGACLVLGACTTGGSAASSGTKPATSAATATQTRERRTPGVSVRRRTDIPAPPSPNVFPSPTPSPSARPSPAPAPAGYTSVSAPTAAITFAAPEDWLVVSASELQTDEAKLEEVANAAGVSAEVLKAAMSTADIYILDQSGTQDFSNNINVLSRTYSSATVTEDAMTTGAKSIGATPGLFSTRSTTNGDAYVLTYTWNLGGQTLEGAAMYVPNADGKYVSVTVTTLDAALTEQVANTIIATVA